MTPGNEMMAEANKPVLIKGGYRSKGTGTRMSRMTDLMKIIQEMNEQEFTGHIKINFSQGGIGRIEKYEEIQLGAQTVE